MLHTQTWTHKTVGVEVQAIQLTHENVQDVADWCNGLEVRELDALDPTKEFVGINVPTFEGRVRASEGDYIVKDSKGGITVRKPRGFTSLFHTSSIKEKQDVADRYRV